MPATGGPIESVTLDGRNFAVAEDAESQRKLGGFENEVQSNGDGTARLIKTRVPLSIDGLTVEIDDDRADQEFLQEIADGNDFVVVAVTYASGKTWQGKAIISDELAYSAQASTAEVTLMGPQEFTQQ